MKNSFGLIKARLRRKWLQSLLLFAALIFGFGPMARPLWIFPAHAQTTSPAVAPGAAPVTAPAAPAPTPLEGDAGGTATGNIGDVATGSATIDPDLVTRIKTKSGKGFPVLADAVGQNRVAINIVWTLITGVLVMFMQAGFACVETGFTRAKNASHTFLMNFSIYFIGILGYWMTGFAFQMGNMPVANLGGTPPAAGGNHAFGIAHFGTLFGTKGFFMAGDSYDVGTYTLFLFQLVFMATAAIIPTGAMLERWKFTSFIPYGFFMSMVLYPMYAHWAWGGGWLSQLGVNFHLGCGYTDFAGSGVVHAIGGLCGLAGASALGPRIGKFNKDGSANAIPGHNVPLALLGALILGFGWFGFNPGSTLGASGVGNLRIGIIATTTMLASAGGGMSAMLYMYWKTKRPDPTMVANGFLAGLVAITAPSAFVSGSVGVLIGAIAGLLTCWSVSWVDRFLIDDPVGAISVHGTCGLWGVISVGLLADGTYGQGWNGTMLADGKTGKMLYGLIPAIMHGDVANGVGQLVAQLIGCVVICVWSFGLSLLFFKTLDRIMGIRSKPEDEIGGLDIPETGILAYPTWPTEVDMEMAMGG